MKVTCSTEIDATIGRFFSAVMLNLARFRDLARQALAESDPTRLRKIVAEMEVLLRAEQSALKELLADRRLHYPGPPIEPGLQ